MKALWLFPAIVWLLLSCASTPARESSTRNTGRPCPNPKYIKFSDGSQFFQVTGRLVSRDRANVLQPVRSAQLLNWVARDNPKAQPREVTIDEEGHFTVEVGLPWSSEEVCRDGQLIETEWVGEEDFVIRAARCSEMKLKVGPKWLPHDIELKCSKSRLNGQGHR